MRYYNLTLETVGPVHIGSGEQISKKECLYDTKNKKIYVMDEKKMFRRILELGKQASFESYLMDSSKRNLYDFINLNRIPPEEYKSWAAYVLDDDNAGNVNNSRSKGGGTDNVQAFMKDAYGCPYIPGSSLKGALRTIIQSCLVYDRYEEFSNVRNDIATEQFKRRPGYLSKANKEIERKLFYTLNRPDAELSNAVNDRFCGIRVSDSAPLTVKDLILCRKTDLFRDGKENSISIKRECLKPGTKINFSVEIDESIFDIDNKKLTEYIDSNYEVYRQAFLLAFPDAALYSAKEGEHMMYLGGGSGYATKTTVYPMYDDIDEAVKTVQKIMINTTSTKKGDIHRHGEDYNRHEVSPHTMKIADIGGKVYEMGLCRVSISAK